MTESTGQSTDHTSSSTTPARRTRRRATAPTMTVPPAPDATEAPAAPLEAAASGETGAPTESGAQTATTSTGAKGESIPVSAGDPDTEQPKARRTRRTSTKNDSKKTDSTTTDSDASAADAAGGAAADAANSSDSDASVEPVITTDTDPFHAPRSRRRSTRSTTASSDVPAPEHSDESIVLDPTKPFLDVRAELGAAFGEREATPPPAATGGPLATTALLFQAPEPRPARRATAPSGPVSERTLDDIELPSRDEEAPAAKRSRRSRKAAETSQSEQQQDTEVAEATDANDEPDHGATEQSDSDESTSSRRRRRRGGRGRRSRAEDSTDTSAEEAADASDEPESSETEGSRRRRRRRRSSDDARDQVTALEGSTRLEAKRQRRKEGRESGRRRAIITEAEFLARRESVERRMLVRERDGRTQIAVLEDGVLVEHYVARKQHASMIGTVHLGKVQNVLPSMEVAFVDIGRGRNAVLYAGEVNWDAAGLEGQPRRIEQALSPGDAVLVQVTKDPIGHKGARLTSQITLAGRYLVYVPGGGMTGISRKLAEKERSRLKTLLKEIVPEGGGVIVRTAAEGASDEDLRADVERLTSQWAEIEARSKTASAPSVLREEPDLAIRVVRDIFNDDFTEMVVSGQGAWNQLTKYIKEMAPDLTEKVVRWTGKDDVFAANRIDEQLAKGLERKVWLPSGGSLIIDRTEAMTVIDVNTGRFTGSGGSLEETVTRNNLEAAEEIVRQLRLRDIGGIIVVDFIDMVLESNRDLLLRRLVECLARDRSKHQVAEVTSLGLVQMTRKRVGQGLAESFTHSCEACHGRGYVIETEPIEPSDEVEAPEPRRGGRRRGGANNASAAEKPASSVPVLPAERSAVNATLATIAAAAASKHADGDSEATEQGEVGGAGELAEGGDAGTELLEVSHGTVENSAETEGEEIVVEQRDAIAAIAPADAAPDLGHDQASEPDVPRSSAARPEPVTISLPDGSDLELPLASDLDPEQQNT